MSAAAEPKPDTPTRIETAPGIYRDLNALSRDAAVQALGETDAPLALADELVAAVTGPALKAAVQARVGMLIAGHDAENDDLLPIGWLPMEARHCFERIRAVVIRKDPDLDEVRRLLAEGVAYGLAAIDRLDRATKRGES